MSKSGSYLSIAGNCHLSVSLQLQFCHLSVAQYFNFNESFAKGDSELARMKQILQKKTGSYNWIRPNLIAAKNKSKANNRRHVKSTLCPGLSNNSCGDCARCAAAAAHFVPLLHISHQTLCSSTSIEHKRRKQLNTEQNSNTAHKIE